MHLLIDEFSCPDERTLPYTRPLNGDEQHLCSSLSRTTEQFHRVIAAMKENTRPRDEYLKELDALFQW
jgi:hypothetical protein